MRFPDPGSAAWLNGARTTAGQVALSLDEPALLHGWGLFETLAAGDGRAIDLDAHLARLRRGAAALGLAWPDEPRLRGDVAAAAKEFGSPAGWLKVLLLAGGKTILCGGSVDARDRLEVARAILLPWTKNPKDPLVSIKTISWAGNALGLTEAARCGADEGLWRNTRGHLAEGCAANVFVVWKRRIFTPGTGEGILPGIVRALTLRAARDLGFHVHEGKVRVPRLLRADEAFLTSSLRGIRPLIAIDGQPVGSGRVGPVTVALADQVARLRGLPGPSRVGLDRAPTPPDL